MKDNRLLVIAVILIAFGMIGIITTAWIGKHQKSTGGWMSPMMDMMGGGMMNRNHMKEMMQRMMPGILPPDIKLEDLPEPNSRGARLFVRYCTQCYYLPSPMLHTADEWPAVANRMFARMSMMGRGMMGIESLSLEEQKTIVTYLKKYSMKSIAPGTLPSPESKGAVFFSSVCSQCHSIPDPKLHTADEWPIIVERMSGHMQSRGKIAITAQEKKEIVSYLKGHARK